MANRWVYLSDCGKSHRKGPNAHPFYKWAADARPKDVPRWNFHKYLVGCDGYIAEVFPETVEPSDTRVKTAIARALAAS
jgi:glutathione peroxidase